MELTQVGRVFLRGARRTLASATEAVAQAQEAAAGERGRLSIGSIGALVHGFLPNALARFRERFPLLKRVEWGRMESADLKSIFSQKTTESELH